MAGCRATRTVGVSSSSYGVTRQDVEDQIEASLSSMCAYRCDSLGPPQLALAGTVCTGDPACALVAAVFESRPWTGA